MTISDTLSRLPIFPSSNLSWTQIALNSLGACIIVILVTYLYRYPYREYTLPFRNLSGTWLRSCPNISFLSRTDLSQALQMAT